MEHTLNIYLKNLNIFNNDQKISFVVPCGKCTQCMRGMSSICTGSFEYFVSGMLLDGTSRIKDKNGKMVRHGNYVSGFSTYTVIPEGGAIPKEFPLEYACLMGCCIPTGWGSVTNCAKVQPGDKVAIYGMGGVGLNILRASAMRQAYPVIAIDIEESKEDLAKEFGATHFICNKNQDPVPIIQKLTDGGADVVNVRYGWKRNNYWSCIGSIIYECGFFNSGRFFVGMHLVIAGLLIILIMKFMPNGLMSLVPKLMNRNIKKGISEKLKVLTHNEEPRRK